MTITLALVMDYRLVRESLKQAIEKLTPYEVRMAVECDSINYVLAKPPKLIVLDLQDFKSLDVYEKIQTHTSEIPILFLISPRNPAYIIKSLYRNGVRGFLSKNSGEDELQQAITHLTRGEAYLPAYLHEAHRQICKKRNGVFLRSADMLSDREMSFLRYCCTDISYQEIAVNMQVKLRSVLAYRDQLFERFDVHSRAQLVMKTIALEIVYPTHLYADSEDLTLAKGA